MPHTWVGSDFMRSVIDMLWYDREADSALVVGAGVPASWVDETPGVVARGLPTPHGTLDLAMRGDGRTVRVQLGGLLRVPPGGIVLRFPYDRRIRSATVNGLPVPVASPSEIVILHLPASVVLAY